MKLLQYLCIPFLLILIGCTDGCSDDPLSITKEDYYGNQLNINGYYYHTFDKYANPERLSEFYFLYRNGVVFSVGAYSLNKIEEVEKNFRSEKWVSGLKKSKTWWGLFRIKENKIEIERWYGDSNGNSKAYLSKGEILNNTTFIIREQYRPEDSDEKTSLNEVYHFKEFSPKPDSTNPFVVIF